MSVSDRIDRYNAEITAIDNEISTIDAAVVGATAVQAYMSDRRASIVSRKTRINARIARLQDLVDNPPTSFQQSVIDGINTEFSNQYATELNQLSTMSSEKRAEFCDVYCQADSTVEKECIIRHFFNL